eukprot:GHVS01010391.1.p1 GENE.GHVS01010391.1~~GHVS01010391.1.p1  ORF type:complete len:210 (-),score=38.04 GHVS01010391.1:1429-2058(-)
MTEFARATEKLTELKELCEELLNCPSEELHLKVERYHTLFQSVATLSGVITKYRMQLAEKDPDKRYYGPKMLGKVQELVERYDVLYEVCEDELKPSYGPILEAKLQQQEMAKAKALQELEMQRLDRVNEGRTETSSEMAMREEDVRRKQVVELGHFVLLLQLQLLCTCCFVASSQLLFTCCFVASSQLLFTCCVFCFGGGGGGCSGGRG